MRPSGEKRSLRTSSVWPDVVASAKTGFPVVKSQRSSAPRRRSSVLESGENTRFVATGPFGIGAARPGAAGAAAGRRSPDPVPRGPFLLPRFDKPGSARPAKRRPGTCSRRRLLPPEFPSRVGVEKMAPQHNSPQHNHPAVGAEKREGGVILVARLPLGLSGIRIPAPHLPIVMTGHDALAIRGPGDPGRVMEAGEILLVFPEQLGLSPYPDPRRGRRDSSAPNL